MEMGENMNKKQKLTIGFPKSKPQFIDAYLCRDGGGTLAIWLGKRQAIHHILGSPGFGNLFICLKGSWGSKGTGQSENWLECEILLDNEDIAYSSEGHEIMKADWPKPGKCVRIKLEIR